ncbi:hypothetical protein CYMTET_56959 [Cymbomonas tetramitiformis]|uniref:Uncharacterized protein n=1 Tax=Cymbomonas tetramitiformis TaxID=36881 RepID=A0AAE0ELG1_9CHLO|nr:hypothetical protein CYMTET_56959 [Cymbomonas tetramitiformis]
MFGFAASIIGEKLTGEGALGQFDIETGLPLNETEPLVLLLIISNIVLPLLPTSGDFVPARKSYWQKKEEEEEFRRKNGPLNVEDFELLIAELVGLTKERELFFGRLAQLGFGSSLIGEVITGCGPLGQLNLESQLPLEQVEPFALILCVFLFLASFSRGTGDFEE